MVWQPENTLVLPRKDKQVLWMVYEVMEGGIADGFAEGKQVLDMDGVRYISLA